MFQQTIKMSSYKQKGCRHTQKKDVYIPQNKDVDITSENNNQSLVMLKFFVTKYPINYAIVIH